MRDVNALYPLLKMLGEELVRRCKKKGLNVKITDCVRTKAEQDECLRKGTSTLPYPRGPHCWGIAFDICFNDKNDPYPKDNTKWTAAGTIGKELGLFWGGDWTTFPDRPHFQLDAFSVDDLIKTYGLPEAFFLDKEFKITTPALAIEQTSVRKKILWLQVRLNIHGQHITIDGQYGPQTIAAVKKFWMAKTGKSCTGKRGSANAVKLLAADPE